MIRRTIVIAWFLLLWLAGGIAAQTPLDQTRARLAVTINVYNQSYELMEVLHRSKKADGSPRLSEVDYQSGKKLAELYLREYYHFVTVWGDYIGFDTTRLQIKSNDFAVFVLQKEAESRE